MRTILAIPLEEVRRYFEVNARQSLKIVAPARMSAVLLERLRAQGVEPKDEAAFDDTVWRHSGPEEPNRLCESGEFEGAGEDAAAGFTISFGTERGAQETHVHERHAEIYFSEHALGAAYKDTSGAVREVDLPHGGVLVFAPGVVHRVRLSGLTLVIETPAIPGDKFSAEL